MSGRRFLCLRAGLLIALAAVVFAGCQTSQPPKAYDPLVARFFIEAKSGDAAVPLRLPISGVTVAVNPKPVIVEYDILNAEVAQVELGRCLMLQLTAAAARDLYRFSASNQGRRLVLSLNDAPVGVRRIEQAMADGVILVFVETPDAELLSLVERLKRTSADIVATAAKNK